MANGQQLSITQTPDAVTQIEVLGNTFAPPPGGTNLPYPVGRFAFYDVPLSWGAPAWFNATRDGVEPAVYTLPLNVVRRVTVQIFPFFNPVLLLVFSNGQTPSLRNGIKILCCGGYDLTTVAGGGIDAAIKLASGVNFFGPYDLPGDHIYFRAYQLNIQAALPGANYQPQITMAGADNLPNFYSTAALVTAVGN